MSFSPHMPRILVIDNYAPDHADYERIAKVSGNIFRKKAQKRIQSFCSTLFSQEVNIVFQKAEQLSFQTLLENLFSPEWDLIIASGSPFNTNEKHEWIFHQINAYKKVLKEGIHAPFLGICFGHQLMALAGGGKIDALSQYYHGKSEITLKDGSSISVFRSHKYHVSRIPKMTNVLATMWDCAEEKKIPFAFSLSSKRENAVITLQFHPEYMIPKKQYHLSPLLRKWLGFEK